MGFPPAVFVFHGAEVRVQVPVAEYQVQGIVNHFKSWLPNASHTLKGILEQEAKNREATRKEELRSVKAKQRNNACACFVTPESKRLFKTTLKP